MPRAALHPGAALLCPRGRVNCCEFFLCASLSHFFALPPMTVPPKQALGRLEVLTGYRIIHNFLAPTGGGRHTCSSLGHAWGGGGKPTVLETAAQSKQAAHGSPRRLGVVTRGSKQAASSAGKKATRAARQHAHRRPVVGAMLKTSEDQGRPGLDRALKKKPPSSTRDAPPRGAAITTPTSTAETGKAPLVRGANCKRTEAFGLRSFCF